MLWACYNNNNNAVHNTPELSSTTCFTVSLDQVLNADERARLASNLAGHMVGAQDFLQQRAIGNFAKADPALGKAIQDNITKIKAKAHL